MPPDRRAPPARGAPDAPTRCDRTAADGAGGQRLHSSCKKRRRRAGSVLILQTHREALAAVGGSFGSSVLRPVGREDPKHGQHPPCAASRLPVQRGPLGQTDQGDSDRC